MPIYEYGCSTCGVTFEKRQSFSEGPVTDYKECPNNHQGCDIRRRVSTPAIVFKGSGFYVTDNRGAKSGAASSTPSKSSGESEGKADSKSETKSESKSEGTAKSEGTKFD